MNVSIIVPCYNQAAFLGECLVSIAAQTWPHWDAIIVDDGSDEPLKVAAAIEAMKDPRFRLCRHTSNRGLAAARNTGIRQARYEWVLVVDSDDRLKPSFLRTVCDEIQAYPDCDVVFTDFELFGAEHGVIRWRPQGLAEFLLDRAMPGPGLLFRRGLWLKVGGYCEAAQLKAGAEDFEFWIRILQSGARVRHVPQALYLYRRHPDSMTVRLKEHRFRVRYFIYKQHEAVFRQHRAHRGYLAAACSTCALAAMAKRRPFTALYYALAGVIIGRSQKELRIARDVIWRIMRKPVVSASVWVRRRLSAPLR